MARPCAFMTFLVLRSYYWSTCSLGCELPQTYNLRSKRTLTLFTQMRRLSLLSYLKNRKKFAFPLEKVDAQQFQKAPVIPAPCPAGADPAVPDPLQLFLGRQPSQTHSSLASTRGSIPAILSDRAGRVLEIPLYIRYLYFYLYQQLTKLQL